MTKHGKATAVLPPRHPQGRRRARRLGRHADRRSTPCSACERGACAQRRDQAAADARPARPPTSRSMPTAPSPPSSARWTWARACSSPSARWWPKSSTCRSRRVKVFMGDTATSVNQGGASGSTGIQLGGKQMRMAAAEARRVLVEMAAAKLGLPADAAHRHRRRRARQERRGEEGVLCRADRRALFQRPARLEQADRQPALRARQGQAEGLRSDYKIVGQPIQREDVAPKVFAQEDFCTDVKVPGMVHGRMIRPAVAGAVPVKVDESSIKDIPGAKVVWDKGFLGVVADKEWDAIKAAQKLKVEWSDAKPPFPESAALYDHIRKAPVRKREVDGKQTGNVDEAFKTAARVIEAEYEWPFQSHASMGPACARGRDQGRQGHLLDRLAEAALRARRRRAHRSACRRTRCTAIWVTGPGSYGRNDAGDCRDGRGRAGEGGRPAGARAIHARRRAPAGTRRARPRSTARARRSTRAARSSPTSSPARASRASTSTPTSSKPCDTLAGQLHRRAAEVRRRLRRAGGVLRSSPTSGWPGRRSRRCSIAPRRCAPRICAIRSGRRSTSPANPSWTRWRTRSTSTRSSSACATSRTRATSR